MVPFPWYCYRDSTYIKHFPFEVNNFMQRIERGVRNGKSKKLKARDEKKRSEYN